MKVLPDALRFSLDRSQSCPNLGEFDAYERDHPLGGMPYGLPGLDEREHGVLTRWLAAGSPGDAPTAAMPARWRASCRPGSSFSTAARTRSS